MAIPRNLSNLAPGADSSGVLGVTKGGTGATSLTANNVLLGNGTSAVQFVAPGTSGNVLTSNGTTWASSTPATGAMTLVSTQTVSGSTSVEWTGLSGTYYLLQYKNIYMGSSSDYYFKIQLGTSSYVTSGYGGYVNYMGSGLSWSAQNNGSDAFYFVLTNDPSTGKFSGFVEIFPSASTTILGYGQYGATGGPYIFPALAVGQNSSLSNPTRVRVQTSSGSVGIYGTFSLYTIT